MLQICEFCGRTAENNISEYLMPDKCLARKMGKIGNRHGNIDGLIGNCNVNGQHTHILCIHCYSSCYHNVKENDAPKKKKRINDSIYDLNEEVFKLKKELIKKSTK